jgi:hypothetical protein
MEILKLIFKKLLQIFEDGSGNLSSTRIYSFIVLLFMMKFNFYYLNKGNNITWEFIMLDLVLLIAIFVPKYLQKLAELKFSK